MPKIMLLTAQHTGRGHMSIAEALSEKFAEMGDVELDVVDGFIFMGSQGVKSSKIYNVVTQRAKFVWKAVFKATQNTELIQDTMGLLVQKQLDRYVRATQPDLILTVHPMFVGSVVDALEREGLNVPVVGVEADIVNIHSAWVDNRVSKIICPTQEAFDTSVELGMSPEKLTVIGFPTRARFCDAARVNPRRVYNPDRPVRCLLTGGGGGAGEIEEYAVALMRDTDAYLTVICGSNLKLKEKLEEKFGIVYSDRMRILGFVTDMESEYEISDIVIQRASPNCMFESIVMGLPMIITGALPGQEKDNPRFAVEHNLGVICESPDELGARIDELTRDNGRRLEEIRDAQIAYRDLDCAGKIARCVRDML